MSLKIFTQKMHQWRVLVRPLNAKQLSAAVSRVTGV